MANYQKMYTTLFNAVTDSLEEMNRLNFGRSREILKGAQIECEAMYIATATPADLGTVPAVEETVQESAPAAMAM